MDPSTGIAAFAICSMEVKSIDSDLVDADTSVTVAVSFSKQVGHPEIGKFQQAN